MPDEPAVREQLGQPVQDAAAAAAGVEHADAVGEPLGQPGHERQDVRLERRQHGLAAVFGHDRVEAREPLVRHAAAVAEALDDVVFDAARGRAMYCAKTAMLSAPAARVRNAACSGGSWKRVARRIDVDDARR